MQSKLHPEAVSILAKLKEGNQRFIDGKPAASHESYSSKNFIERREELAQGQSPFAIVLCCSDSRVPAEAIFDQDNGSLFVIRVAGNIAETSQLASIEFAVASFASPLIIVMGHSSCGAIAATLAEATQPSNTLSPSLTSLVNHIKPNVEQLLKTELKDQPEKLAEAAVKANVEATVQQLSATSDIIKNAIQQQKLNIIGSEYCLKTGAVAFFEESII